MPFDAAPVVRSPLPSDIAALSALALDMVGFYFRDRPQWAQGIGSEDCSMCIAAMRYWHVLVAIS